MIMKRKHYLSIQEPYKEDTFMIKHIASILLILGNIINVLNISFHLYLRLYVSTV